MKKLLLSITALVILGVSTASAQGFQGKWWLMGEVGFNSAAKGNLTSYSIVPTVGYFVAPTTTIGLGIGYKGTTDKTTENQKVTTSNFVITPLARQYFPITDKFLIFGQAAVPLTFGKDAVETGNVKITDKKTTYGIQLAPGIDYFLADNLSIEATFGVLGWKAEKPDGGDAQNQFNFGINSNGSGEGLKLGIKLFF